MAPRLVLLTLQLLLLWGLWVVASERVVAFLPCYGGHFGSMTQLIAALHPHHQITVVTPGPCPSRADPFFSRLPGVEHIQWQLLPSEISVTGKLDFALKFPSEMRLVNEQLYEHAVDFLSANQNRFDVIITDILFEGVMIATEEVNKPLIVNVAGDFGAVPNNQDAVGISIMDIIGFKILFQPYSNWRNSLRAKLQLTQLKDMTSFSLCDYYARFPNIITGAPVFNPEVHPSVPHVYSGALRVPDTLPELVTQLSNWLDFDTRDVIYVSMGTISWLDPARVMDVLSLDGFRVVLAVTQLQMDELQNSQASTTKDIYIGVYLPQFKLLAHPIVKVFVTHGGQLSTLDSLRQHVPTICIPQFADQFYNCRKIQELQLGVSIQSLNKQEISAALSHISQYYAGYLERIGSVYGNISSYEDVGKLNSFVSEVTASGKTQIVTKFAFPLNSARAVCSFYSFVIMLLFVGLTLVLYFNKALWKLYDWVWGTREKRE